MTNAEKYRLTGIEAYNLSQELGEYLTIEKKAEGVFVSDINSFFVKATKPILTEDERVILRNINKQFIKVGRDSANTIYFVFEEFTGNEAKYYANVFDNVFQFIKERRRI